MSAIVTTKSRIDNALRYLQYYFNAVDGENMFIYAGHPSPWEDDLLPPTVQNTVKDNRETKRSIIFAKRLYDTESSLCIKRFDWTSGNVYTPYQCDVDVIDYFNWVTAVSPFYVYNSEGNLYKCINNNLGEPSTIEPIGQSTGTISTADGYIWKFMLDLDVTISDAYLSSQWIPIPVDEADKSPAQVSIEAAAVSGTIDYIRVDLPGADYSGTVNVVIDGDGVGAVGVAIIGGDSTIERINITNPGSGYTWATVTLIPLNTGSGATASAMISPNGGHGSSAYEELGASFIMLAGTFTGDEAGAFPAVNSYRKIGVIKNLLDDTQTPITTSTNFLSTINLTNITSDFVFNETVYGMTSQATALIFNKPDLAEIAGPLSVIDVQGTFLEGEDVIGQTSGCIGSISTVINTSVDIESGDLIYKENIKVITRRNTQVEKFRFTIEF